MFSANIGTVVSLNSLETQEKKGSAVLLFSDEVGSFGLYVPKEATPKNVADILSVVATGPAGEVFCKFVREVSPTITTRVVRHDDAKGPNGDFRYTVLRRRDHSAYLVKAETAGHNGRNIELYNGSLIGFVIWAKEYTGSGGENLVGRVVKFNYSSGSESGYRVVRVEEARRLNISGRPWLIKGKDVVKDEYRSYRSDRITGDLILVN